MLSAGRVTQLSGASQSLLILALQAPTQPPPDLKPLRKQARRLGAVVEAGQRQT
jgi:hypothetical protein